MDGIRKIQTFTLSNQDPDCLTYEKTVDFLSNILINERNCHFHYNRRRPVYFVEKTLVLFKYERKLIAKGIFINEFRNPETVNGINYSGYYLVDKDSIEIFTKPIGLNDIRRYVNDVKSLNRDQIINLKYLNEVNQMIEDFCGEVSMTNQYDVAICTITWYLRENNLGNFVNEDYERKLSNFQKKFSIEVLQNLEGIDILNTIFPHDSDKSTLCYALEFGELGKGFGSISGGSVFKFSLFKYSKTNKWTVGSAKSNLKTISEDEAIKIASKIRDAIVEGANYIKNNTLETIEDYIRFESELNNIFRDVQNYCPVKPTHTWIHKYYVMTFPDKFQRIHSDSMKKDFLYKFRLEPEEGYYANDGQFYQFAKDCNIKLYSLFNEDIVGLFFDGDDIWDPIEKGKLVDLDVCENSIKPYVGKRNLIYFGAPGTGKSYNLNQDKNKLLKDFPDNYERVTFHPDYSYASFVGTYKPVPEGKDITYKYVPGPFMRILKKALDKPSEPFLLIIEEINRANVAAVFGDVFQLLDRENNESMYPIDATEDMKTYINKDKIILPQNLFIWATMNSADQGVFMMDTAFKRRWDFKYFSINNNENLIANTKVTLNNMELSWNDLRKAINDELLSYKINEDKLIGPFFAFNDYHNQEIPTETFKDIFKNKIIMYLFEDAARSRRNELFSGVGKNTNITYSQICEAFDKNGIEIFNDSIKDKFLADDGE